MAMTNVELYEARTGTLRFPSGAVTRRITVNVVADQFFDCSESPEGPCSETFFVKLFNPSGATIGDGRGAGRINDDDPFQGGE